MPSVVRRSLSSLGMLVHRRVGRATEMSLGTTFRNSDWYFLIAILMSTVVILHIALTTEGYSHPDEIMHVDAMCYFESNWWPPSLDDDRLQYSPDGWSRVYNGELVYWIYGKIGHLLKPLSLAVFYPLHKPLLDEASPRHYSVFLPVISAFFHCERLFQPYRLLNVLLYLVTMLVLFRLRHKSVLVGLIGLTLLCIPQVLYTYAYANSDAWGISIIVFLFVFLLTTQVPIGGYRYGVMIGLFSGILVLSKLSYWLSLSWAAVLVISRYVAPDTETTPTVSRAQIGACLALFALTFLLIVGPVKIVYPLTQGDWSRQAELMREQRSKDGYRPSQPTNKGYRLAAKGEGIDVVLANPTWFERSVKSFYGYFGAMSMPLSDWQYYTALGIGVVNIGITVATARNRWLHLSLPVRLLILSAPLCILLCFLASIYNSWTYDFQPQGRYLFAALPSVAILLAGTIPFEPTQARLFRMLSWVAGYLLCLYALAVEILL